MTTSLWTNETIARLGDLWRVGKSAGQIATEMGLSRNAVIGKVHRLALHRDPQRIEIKTAERAERLREEAETALRLAEGAAARAEERKREVEARRKAKDEAEARRVAQANAKAEKVAARRAYFAEVQRKVEERRPLTVDRLLACHCRWIIGPVNGAETIYCGATRVHPSSYCAEHRSLARGSGTPSERRAHRSIPSVSAITGDPL